jgi:hypothetical protein
LRLLVSCRGSPGDFFSNSNARSPITVLR